MPRSTRRTSGRRSDSAFEPDDDPERASDIRHIVDEVVAVRRLAGDRAPLVARSGAEEARRIAAVAQDGKRLSDHDFYVVVAQDSPL